jgi:uncharacterized protein YndB with AHSA1/START domain
MTILLVVLTALAAFLAFVATRASTFRIERTATIKAPPAKIFGMLEDFHRWTSWSPWEKLDPALQRTYSGAASGKGAIYSWEGNRQVGAGRMEIQESAPSSRLAIKLDFLRPFKAQNAIEFSLKPLGDGTNVSWVMTGNSNFMSKMMSVFMSMDKMVGKDFETGLANLKAEAER